jgi:GT2 family glycosyltransferase
MDKVSFAVPIYNKWHLTHQLLFDIYQKCPDVHEVVLVNDNCNDKDVLDGLKWWESNGMLNIKTIKLSKNVMFLRASNIAIQNCTGDVIITISNDVRIHRDIVSPIFSALEANKKTLMGGRMLDWDTGWNTFNGKIFPYLEGWLLATTKENWEELGYFDERYMPSDMEDVDISTTAKSKGYMLESLASDITTHLGAQSIGFNPAREAITLTNKEKFRQKWLG